MADDAGALLVRSGLVSSNALDDARARVASIGGTLGEQLVTNGAISDDELTAFYRSRLLVPQVNPNTLARLTPKVVATIPSDMAIELRAIPVSLDGDNNLTVAMSDPSDRHAVDEIAFFTGTYVVRAVATQMQIAWCLAHYYGHVTALGQRLLYTSEGEAPVTPTTASGSQQMPRAKGSNENVDAARHRAIPPITGPVDALRPSSGDLDLRPVAAPEPPAGAPTSAPVSTAPLASPSTPASAARSVSHAPISTPASAPRLPPSTGTPVAEPGGAPSTATAAAAPRTTPSTSTPTAAPAPGAGTPTPPAPTSLDDYTPVIIEIVDDAAPSDDQPARRRSSSTDLAAGSDGPPDRQRARSVSGEIRVPPRRAASIRPPMPQPDSDDDDEPLIVIEQGGSEDDTARSRTLPRRRRVVKSDPPELYARAGEVDLKTGDDRAIDADEPRIVVDEDALATPTSLMARRVAIAPPLATPDAFDDADTGALIQDHIAEDESVPILLERPRTTPEQVRSAAPVAPAPTPGRADDDDTVTGETHIVVLNTKKPRPRPERRTQVGIPPAPVPVARLHRDTETSGIPTMIDPPEIDPPKISRTQPVDDDATTLDLRPASPDDDTTSEQLVAPSPPAGYDHSDPNLIVPPPPPAQARPAALQQAVIIEELDAEDGDDEESGPRTSVMSAVELDAAIPERTAEVVPAHLSRRRIDHQSVDDGWGPPGTTIPPPLLGAIPGSDDDDEAASVIPMPDIDSSPLVVGPPPLPSTADSSGLALVRALEQATARAIEVIRQLEHAESRDEVVDVMVAHLAETHYRAGFFATRHGSTKGVTELGLFVMTPKPAVIPFATLRLDRPSTLQDVVGTRLPYRGPMHDDASRTFLISILGACPAEILLVPVAVRERVVGVLFGEHRQRHTFDDQLALAARAAGMALERILKSKRG